MKRFLLHTISALLLLAITPAYGQQTKMLSADKATDYGLAYSLPVTALKIDVIVKQTESVPGPYYQYAKRYLGRESVITEPSQTINVENVNVQSFGVPGSTKYVMQLKPGALTRICVSEDGMLTAINTENEIAVPASPAAPVNTPVPDMDEYLKYVDSDFLASISSARRAEMLAQTIMEIRDSRLSLSRGTAETMPVDGRQLELMLQSLEQQENALVRAFTGYTHTSYSSGSYTVIPDSTAAGSRMTVCRLSNEAGLLDGNAYAGDPLYLEIGAATDIQWPLNARGEEKELPKDGVIYSLPAASVIKLIYRGNTIFSNEQEFSQFGRTFALDPKLFTDRKAPSCATFSPVTGALLTLETMK